MCGLSGSDVPLGLFGDGNIAQKQKDIRFMRTVVLLYSTPYWMVVQFQISGVAAGLPMLK